MPQRLLTFALLSLAATTGARDASALGFGRSLPVAVLGQPLDFSVALRVEAGEVLAPGCVWAEVSVGDITLPRTAVGASLETVSGVPSVRVRTSSSIDEPVVAVTVTAGCEAKVSRRFTLFADPPGLNLGAVAANGEPDATVMPAMLVPDVPEPVARAASAPRSESPAPAVLPATPPLRSAAAAPAARAPRPARQERAAASTKPVTPAKMAKAAKGASRTRPALAAAGPRLRLDTPGPSAAALAAADAASAAERELALRMAEQAASAAQAAAQAASSRVAAVEAEMQAVKREAQAHREQMQRLAQALADAESRGRWTPLLLAALLAMGGLAGWLWWRLREVRAERAQGWWSEQRAAAGASPQAPDAPVTATPTDASPFVAAPVRQPAVARSVAPPVAALEPLPEPHMQRTEPLTNAVLVPDPPTRDVSIDELLDLEQQAEFFIVLGQDEAAIELLVEHLRSSGGTSPLPYLKLMDIYRRRGDEAAYARTRDRFNHRFNAIAPGFGADLRQGRTLETYPDVIAQLQRSWPRSVDAMADLETLLFRSDGSQLFDLPAYREVLFLYSLARDLLEHGEAAPPRIDVLLPLADSADFRNTGTRPQLAPVPTPGERAEVAREDQATTPVDLDLSEPVKLRAPSQFGFFEDAPSRTA